MSFLFIIGFIALFILLLLLGLILNFVFTVFRGIVSIGDILPWRKNKSKANYSTSSYANGSSYTKQSSGKSMRFDKSNAEDVEYEETN